MAEGGIVGGIFDGEEEAAEQQGARESLISADGFAAALAAIHSGGDPAVAGATKIFLEKQAHLLDVQVRHIEDEHPLRMSHLHHQSLEGRLRRIGQRIRIGLQIFVSLIATAFGAGLVLMVHDAFQSRSVVVDAFKAPSALAGRGVTGEVVASGVLDALQKLREATRSATRALDVQGAWSSEVRIEVPETGMSIGEIDRLLHERFGHDVHVTGDLVQTVDGGLALTVRGNEVLPKTFAGGAGDLDRLTAQAAEYVYGRSQPLQFAHYLNGNSRYDDALAFLPSAFARADSDDQRAELATEWGVALASLNKPVAAAEKHRMAMALKPHFWRAWQFLVGILPFTEGEELGWREARAFLQAADSAPEKDRPPLAMYANPAQLVWDLPAYLTALQADAAYNGGGGTFASIAGPFIADTYALMHDPAKAAQNIAASDPDDSLTKAEVLLVQSYAAFDRNDAQAALAPLQAYWKSWQSDSSLEYALLDEHCLVGWAYGLTGHKAEAEAAFKSAGPWSRCAAYHGDVLERGGDLAGAERVWEASLKATPDLPWVYLHRGLSEMKRGDLEHAETDLATASAKAPHWADPWKAWGDLLAVGGKAKEALAKYDMALKYAPDWAELHQARDDTAKQMR